MKVNHLCLLLFVCVLQASDADTSLKEVKCASAVHDCPPHNICRVNCDDDCIKNGAGIVGTVIYPEHSPICKSAIHDFRISTSNASERSVTFQRWRPRNVFLGSKRMRISSKSLDVSGHLRGEDGIKTYIFLSPYISENILDIATVHTGYLFGEDCTHKQTCFESEESDVLKFVQYCNTNIKEPCIIPASRGGVGILQAQWTVGNRSDEILNAGYQCFVENKTLSTITSIAFKKNAYFFPATLTKTVNVNDTVSLQMTENGFCKDKATIWRKDRGNPITRGASRTSIFFPIVEVGNAGIYSLECGNSDASRAGFVQLIVRACPELMYGHLCAKDCRQCLNGGICHDLNGECICAPGFHGTTCEKTCPPGYFGRNCHKKCSPYTVPGTRACKEVSICLPHPYGCSCGAGYKGIFCNETCKPGSFGAGCKEKRKCRCANGNGCNIYTGSCDGDCATGWFGKNCDDPAVTIDIPVSSSMNVIWRLPSEFFLLLLLFHTALHMFQ